MRLRPAVLAAVITVPFGLWFAAALARAQQPPAPIPLADHLDDQQVLGIFTRISRHTAQLQPMLEQVRAQDWIAKGAPETYLAQLTSARQQIEAIETEMTALAQHPDHMQDCMKALFRVQAFHRSLDSLMGGLRRYQNPALADLIQSVAAEDQGEMDKLQTYILDLANEKEQEFQVVDREAQRCRATLSRQPAATPKTARRNNP